MVDATSYVKTIIPSPFGTGMAYDPKVVHNVGVWAACTVIYRIEVDAV